MARVTGGEDRTRYAVQTVASNHEKQQHDFGYHHSVSHSAGREGIGL